MSDILISDGHAIDPMLTTSDREFAEGVSRTLEHLLVSRGDAVYRIDPQHRTITSHRDDVRNLTKM